MKYSKNHLRACLCAALISTSSVPAFASEIPLPERKPAYASASMDQVALAETRQLLAKLSHELRNPPAPAQTAPVQHTSAQQPAQQPAQQGVDIGALSISQQGDTDLSCGALSTEAAKMRDIIFTTQGIKDSTNMKSHGLTAAGAIGSFLVGTVTGGVGLAVGGLLLDHNLNQTEEEADAIQDTAEQRRTLMMGIFNAKGCEGPLEHAMQNPGIFDPLDEIASIETAAGAAKSDYNQ